MYVFVCFIYRLEYYTKNTDYCAPNELFKLFIGSKNHNKKGDIFFLIVRCLI